MSCILGKFYFILVNLLPFWPILSCTTEFPFVRLSDVKGGEVY